MALVGFTDILFQVSGIGVIDVGDLQYIVTQEFNGNVIRLTGNIDLLTNTLTHPVSVGKDAYILVAKIVPSRFVSAVSSTIKNGTVLGNNHTEAKISIDTTELDRVTVGSSSSARAVGFPNDAATEGAGHGGSGYGSMTDGIFYASIGAKATTGELIVIENTLKNGTCVAQMVILEIDTGTSPAI